MLLRYMFKSKMEIYSIFIVFIFSKPDYCPMTSHYYFSMQNCHLEWKDHRKYEQNLLNMIIRKLGHCPMASFQSLI